MCAHLRMTQQHGRQLARELGVDAPADFDEAYRPSERISPSEPAWIVVAQGGGQSPRLALARFGFRQVERRTLLFNARAETVHRVPAFRDAFVRRRCLVPVDGFYEWTGERGSRRPLLFRRADGGLLVLLGLHEEQLDERTGELRTAFTVLTTAAGPGLASLHDRMPAVTTPGDPRIASWMAEAAPGEWSARPLLDLLKPPPDDLLVIEELARRPPEPRVRLPRRPPAPDPAGGPAADRRALPPSARRRPVQLELFA